VHEETERYEARGEPEHRHAPLLLRATQRHPRFCIAVVRRTWAVWQMTCQSGQSFPESSTVPYASHQLCPCI
jgi:hypothetical protein